MGRKKVKTESLWDNAGGIDSVIKAFLKNGFGKKQKRKNKETWTSLALHLFDNDSSKCCKWLQVIWTENRRQVREKVFSQYEREKKQHQGEEEGRDRTEEEEGQDRPSDEEEPSGNRTEEEEGQGRTSDEEQPRGNRTEEEGHGRTFDEEEGRERTEEESGQERHSGDDEEERGERTEAQRGQDRPSDEKTDDEEENTIKGQESETEPVGQDGAHAIAGLGDDNPSKDTLAEVF